MDISGLQEALRDILQRLPWLTLELELPEFLETQSTQSTQSTPPGKGPRPVEVRHAFSLLRLMRPKNLRTLQGFETAVEEQQLEILICKRNATSSSFWF